MSPQPPTTLAQAGWNALVNSMEAVVEGTGDAWPLLIALAVLAVIWIDLRLARWITRSLTHNPHTTQEPKNRRVEHAKSDRRDAA